MMLGKRKREAAVVSRQLAQEDLSRSPSPRAIDAQELLRKHFEARFEPLDQTVPTRQVEPETSSESDIDGEEGSDWDGISNSDDDAAPEVVEHTDSYRRSKGDGMDKLARKEFMTTKPPSSAPSRTKPKPKPGEDDQDDQDTDAANLKNDLALQRLLNESHLLDSASDLNPTGKNRHRALDMRMQAIGADSSLYRQKKMPMAQRKGIEAKAALKEEKRRREARENGIVLEKPVPPSSKKKTNPVRRERGVGGPSVGRFAEGTLNLSKKDVADIRGPQNTGRRGKGKGKGKKGRK